MYTDLAQWSWRARSSKGKNSPVDNGVHFITHHCNCILSEQLISEHSWELIIPNKRLGASIKDVNLRGSLDYSLLTFSTLSNKGSFQTKWPWAQKKIIIKNNRFSGTNQKPELLRPFGTGPLKPCPRGLFSCFLPCLCWNFVLSC